MWLVSGYNYKAEELGPEVCSSNPRMNALSFHFSQMAFGNNKH